jgi:hypothetical protein
MKEYTEAIHAKKVARILGYKNICSSCPVGNFTLYSSDPCDVCRDFVGVKDWLCPCNSFGKKEAIKRTLLALEEKGYI